jgi:hypothetical protein
MVPSSVNVPPVARPPPPAMTDFVIVNVPPDCASEVALIAATPRKRMTREKRREKLIMSRFFVAHLI